MDGNECEATGGTLRSAQKASRSPSTPSTRVGCRREGAGSESLQLATPPRHMPAGLFVLARESCHGGGGGGGLPTPKNRQSNTTVGHRTCGPPGCQSCCSSGCKSGELGMQHVPPLRWSEVKKQSILKQSANYTGALPQPRHPPPLGWHGWPATRSRAQIPKVTRSVAARSHGAASKIAVSGQKLLRGAAESGICGSTHRTGTGAIFGSATFSRD